PNLDIPVDLYSDSGCSQRVGNGFGKRNQRAREQTRLIQKTSARLDVSLFDFLPAAHAVRRWLRNPFGRVLWFWVSDLTIYTGVEALVSSAVGLGSAFDTNATTSTSYR